jgi:hypothetical protein
MKMFYKGVFLVLFFSSFIAKAQQVAYSDLKKISGKTSQFKILGKNNEGIILHEYGKYDNIIEAYSASLKLKWRKNLNIKQPNAQIKKVLLFPEQTNIVYVAPNKESWNIYAQSMDAKFTTGLKFAKLDSVYYGKESLADNIKVSYSNNRDKLAIYYPIPGKNSMNFILLNKDLEVLLKKQVDFLLPEGDYSLNDVLIDDDANLFVVLFDNTKLKRDDSNYDRMKFFALMQGEEQPQLISFLMNRNLFGLAKFQVDNVNKNIVAIGLYTDEAKKQAKGYYYKTYSIAERKLVSNNTIEFSSDLYKQVVGKDGAQSLDGLSTFEITDVVLRFDGGAIIVAESRFNNVENMQIPSFVPAAGPTFRTVTVNYYNDILVLSVTPEGGQEWFKLLRKKQISEDDSGYFSSYAMHIRGGELNFIYNEELYQKTNVGGYKVDPKGELLRSVAFNSGDQDLMVAPRSAKQISSNEIIIPGFRKNNLRLVKLTYQ